MTVAPPALTASGRAARKLFGAVPQPTTDLRAVMVQRMHAEGLMQSAACIWLLTNIVHSVVHCMRLVLYVAQV